MTILGFAALVFSGYWVFALCQDEGCPARAIAWKVDRNNCSVSYMCVNGRAVNKIECPQGRVIGTDGYSCVLKDSIFDGCGRRFEGSIDDPRCSGNPNGENPYPENCAQFISCRNRTSVALQNCPGSLLFSTARSICDYPENVVCRDRTIPISLKGQVSIGEKCRQGQSPNIPHETDCSKFYECQGGLAYPKSCSSYLVFSRSLGRCEEPSKVRDANC